MPPKISNRTQKVREIVGRVPPEMINITTPTDLREELEDAGVAPRNNKDLQTIYAEFSRRRRKLGLLRSQLKEHTVTRKTDEASRLGGMGLAVLEDIKVELESAYARYKECDRQLQALPNMDMSPEVRQEGVADLQDEMDDLRHHTTVLENVKNDVERKMADLKKAMLSSLPPAAVLKMKRQVLLSTADHFLDAAKEW